MATSRTDRRIKAVDKTLDIVCAIRDLRGATVTELSDVVGLTPGTVHTHLATLCDHGIVVKDGTTYQLGLTLVTLGEYVRHQNVLYQSAKQHVDRLAIDTGECIHLFCRDGGQAFLLYESYGANAFGTRLHDRLGEEPYQHLHCSAGGKAILAHMTSTQVDEIVDRYGLTRLTRNTITDREVLFEDLAAVRERGFAINDEELVRGQRAVGVPILDGEERPLGAISLSAPLSRLDGDRFDETVPDLLADTANLVELEIQTAQFEL